MADLPPVTVESLRELYARLELFPSDQELEAAVATVQGFYDGARQIEELLALEQEPASTFGLEAS